MRLVRGKIPLHVQLETLLRSRIQGGEFKPNDLIPTEHRLCREYGVSRTTVRQTLQSLLQDGLIYRQVGRGTFVAPGATNNGGMRVVGSIEDMVAYAKETVFRLLDRRETQAEPQVARRLGVSAKARVVRIDAIRSMKRRPLSTHTIFLPHEIGELIPREALSGAPVITLVEARAGVFIREAVQWIQAVLADRTTADRLGLRRGSPILWIERVYYSDGGNPVEYAITRLASARSPYWLRLLRRAAG
jgi:GntR family transcriptional regulator